MERLYMPFVKAVRLVVTHYRPHLDEIAAWWLALMFGESIFPGIRDAAFNLWNAGVRTPDGRTPRRWKEESGALLLGVGGAKTAANPDGAEFDEHGLPEGSDESCITLMAKALGKMSDPLLVDLIRYTHANDRRGKSVYWDAASLLKRLNAYTVNVNDVIGAVFSWIDAHYARRFRADDAFTNHKHAAAFDAHLARWLWEAYAGPAAKTSACPTTSREAFEFLRLTGREDLGKLEQLAYRDHTKGCCTPFDIVTIFSELVENGADADAQHNFVYVNMTGAIEQQRRLMQAMDEVDSGAHVHVAWVGDPETIERLRQPRTVPEEEMAQSIAAYRDAFPNCTDADIEEFKRELTGKPKVAPDAVIEKLPGIKPMQVVSCVTDNEEILRALRLRFPHANFYIRRQATRHTVINGPKHLMDSVAAELRVGENIRRNGHTGYRIPTEDLRRPGNIPNEWCWTYHKEGGQMLNGSLTSPGTPPTALSLERIVWCIGRALQYQARTDVRLRTRTWRPEHKRRSDEPGVGNGALKTTVPPQRYCRQDRSRSDRKGTIKNAPKTVAGESAALSTLGTALLAAGVMSSTRAPQLPIDRLAETAVASVSTPSAPRLAPKPTA